MDDESENQQGKKRWVQEKVSQR